MRFGGVLVVERAEARRRVGWGSAHDLRRIILRGHCRGRLGGGIRVSAGPQGAICEDEELSEHQKSPTTFRDLAWSSLEP